MAKKLKIAREKVREMGIWGFIRYVLFEGDSQIVGRWVELWGGDVSIEGLHINTNSKVIPTRNKSQIIQGRFEKPERESIKQFLTPTLPVIELGGSLGVVACMTNRLLKDPQHHVVVEAHPDLARLLEKNRQTNHCSFTIIQKAIAYGVETIDFYESGFSSGIEKNSGQKVTVPTTTLSHIVEQYGFKIFSLICDIEGAEESLLEHEKALLQEAVSCIIIELHPEFLGEARVSQFLATLIQLGFKMLHQEKNVYVFKNQHIS